MPPELGRRRVTIKDVAAHCGVSTSAVSNVLRRAYGVSPQMQAKVEAAIAELGYRPHAGARAMRGSSFTLGVLVPDVQNPFIAAVIDGIAEHVRSTNYVVLMGAGRGSVVDQRRIVEGFVDRQVDGVILIAPALAEDWLTDLADDVSTVVIGRHGGSAVYDTVVADDAHGARLVVDHLVELGHRRIAHIASGNDNLRRPHVLPQTPRLDAFRKRMREHGLERHASTVTTSYTELGGYEGAMSLLRQSSRPTAVFAGADIAAFGVLRAAAELGLSIPEDLCLAGYDNSFVAALPQVDLTSVDQEALLTGRTAARLLLERIDGRTAPVLFSITPSLVVRGTTRLLVSDQASGVA